MSVNGSPAATGSSEVRRLLDGDGSGASFRDAYHRLLQGSPDVVLAHGRLLAYLNEPAS